MTGAPYRLAESPGARLGLIVLHVDETIEQDFRRLFAPEAVRLHVTRLRSGDTLTPETISGMAARLPETAALLPPSAAFDAVGYACTSGAALIGADRVRRLVQGGVQTRAVTDPLTAVLTAARALDIRRMGIVSPYVESVLQPFIAAIEAEGLGVPETLSFGEETEANVARIDPASTAEAARALARRGGIDSVFLSCTNLRTLDLIRDLEAELGLPVMSSNLVLAWHMARLSGAPCGSPRFGRLFGL